MHVKSAGIAAPPSYLKCTLYMYMPCPKYINQRKRRGEGGVGEKDSSTALAMAIKLYLDSAYYSKGIRKNTLDQIDSSKYISTFHMRWYFAWF